MKKISHRHLVGRLGQAADEILRRLLSTNLGNFRVHGFQVVGSFLIVLVENTRVDVHTGIVGEEFLLFGSPFICGGVVGGPQLFAQGRFQFLKVLRQRFVDVLLLLVRLFFDKLLRFGFDFVRLLSVRVGV
jgi:hypothetical protein